MKKIKKYNVKKIKPVYIVNEKDIKANKTMKPLFITKKIKKPTTIMLKNTTYESQYQTKNS
jgi:hypothetical protein